MYRVIEIEVEQSEEVDVKGKKNKLFNNRLRP